MAFGIPMSMKIAWKLIYNIINPYAQRVSDIVGRGGGHI